MQSKIIVKSTVWKYLFVYLYIFLLSGNTVLFGTNMDMMFIRIGQLFCACSILFMLYKTENINKSNPGVFILGTIFIIISILFNLNLNPNNFYVIQLFFSGMLFVNVFSLDEFALYFTRILLFLAVFSICTMVVFLLIPSLANFFPLIENSAHNYFYNLGFAVVPVNFQTSQIRNYGIFREPGVYQLYLALGILFEIKYKYKKSTRDIIIFLITLLTTLSTTGYIAALLLIGIYLVQNKNIVSRKKKTLIFLGCCIVAIYLITSTGFIISYDGRGYSVFGKLKNIKDIFGNSSNINISTLMRFSSPIINIVICLSSIKAFIFGISLDGIYQQFPVLSRSIFGFYSEYPTDTLLLQYARFGILWGLFFTKCFISLSNKIGDKPLERFLLMMLFLVELLTENYTSSTLLYVLLWYGASKIRFEKRRINLCSDGREIKNDYGGNLCKIKKKFLQ